MGAKQSRGHCHSNYVHPSPSTSYSAHRRRVKSRYRNIALKEAGLESSNLIIGVDFTKSNEWTGARSFNRRSLHHLGELQYPYERAISIIGKTLSSFDEDNLIPCYGFGDGIYLNSNFNLFPIMKVKFQSINFFMILQQNLMIKKFFSVNPDDRPCNGFEEVLSRYRELVPCVKLAGPTSFAPIIETAIGIVDKSRGQYHVLLIIADGQIVTRSIDTKSNCLSPQEQSTVNAIVKASVYPLSIVLVGVGDGPWDMMHKFDDYIPERAFDNFQFVNFTEIVTKDIAGYQKEAEFALEALMEIPSQYKATIELQILGAQRGSAPMRLPLPPPITNMPAETSLKYSRSNSSRSRTFHPSPSGRFSQNMIFLPCLHSHKDLALGCGHQTCWDCGKDLIYCPVCESHITVKIQLI
ncbi:hypothetical protein UlMin_016520 [Ulmus minor]